MTTARQRARRLYRWVAHAVALAVFASSLLFAGSVYAFCPHAKRAMRVDRCCGGKHQSDGERVARPEVRRRGCCEVRTLDTLPAADTSAHGVCGPPPAVAETPTPALPPSPLAERQWLRVASSPPHAAVPIRAGPLRAGRRIATLQVDLR